MGPAAAFLSRLDRWADPGRRGAILRGSAGWFGALLWGLPAIAFAWRVFAGRPDRPLLGTGVLLGSAVLAALTLGWVRGWRRRPDPYALARAADARLGSRELVLTATDILLTRREGLFAGSVVERAQSAVQELGNVPRPRVAWTRPPMRRLAGALFLSWLLLWLPSAAGGLFGPDRPGVAPGAASTERALQEGGSRTDGTGVGKDGSGRLALDARTDRKLYLFGEEVQLDVTVVTQSELSGDLPLILSVRVDGRNIGAIRLDRRVSRRAGARVQERHPLTPLLRAAGLYEPGVHSLEVHAHADTPPGDPSLDVDVPPSSFRIGENVEKQRRQATARRPKPPPPAKDSKSKRAGRSPKKQKRRPRPSPQKGAGRSAPAPKAKERPYVVEPLFAGNQTTKRKVRVFDRGKTEGEPPPSKTPRSQSPRRRYRKLDLERWKRMPLGGKERRIVATYFRRLTGGEADH